VPATPDHGRGIAVLLGGAPDPDAPAVVFRVDGAEVDATDSVAFRNPLTPGVIGGVAARRANPELLVPGAEWDAHGLKGGSLVTVAGDEYTIASADRDESDLVEARLRESRL